MSQTFRATLQQTGKTACGIEVPESVVDALGGSKRPAVVVTLDHDAYRSTVAPMSGGFWVGVNSHHREASGLKAGEEVQVTLALDTAPRLLEVPPELAAALEADPTARAFFDGLSYSKVAACLARPTVRRGAPSFAEPKSLVDAARLQWLAPPMY